MGCLFLRETVPFGMERLSSVIMQNATRVLSVEVLLDCFALLSLN